MVLATTIQEVRTAVKAWKKQGLTVGFVPTMGYLHEGHQSLIDAAVAQNDKVVVSIFVKSDAVWPNRGFGTISSGFGAGSEPLQSGRSGFDLSSGARRNVWEKLLLLCEYDWFDRRIVWKKPPGSFSGRVYSSHQAVEYCTAGSSLFWAESTQQLVVIRRMVEDLNMDVTIVGCPIIREPDGLAKSSRNTYLSPEERQAALVLSRALKAGKEKLEQGVREADLLLDTMREIICQEPMAKIDYVELVDAETLQPINRVDREILVALAVFVGKTRLIDNFIFTI